MCVHWRKCRSVLVWPPQTPLLVLQKPCVSASKLLGSGRSSQVSSSPVMMGSYRCAKKRCAWGASHSVTTPAPFQTIITHTHATSTRSVQLETVLSDTENRNVSFAFTGESVEAQTRTFTHAYTLSYRILSFLNTEESSARRLRIYNLYNIWAWRYLYQTTSISH